MKDQFKEMLQEVKGLTTKLDSPSRSRQDPLPSWPSSSTSLCGQLGTSSRVDNPHTLDPKVAEIIDIARRTVGLHKIDSDDLARMRLEQHGGATTEEKKKH